MVKGGENMKVLRILLSIPFWFIGTMFIILWAKISGLKCCPYCTEPYEDAWYKF